MRPWEVETGGQHRSVLLTEAVDFLNVQAEGYYLDATLGGGGHSRKILERSGYVLGLDVDPEAVSESRLALKQNPRFKAVVGNFRRLDEIAKGEGYQSFSGVIFDLGLSTFQLKSSGRGFSYTSNEDLDMRSDPSLTTSAKDIVNRFSGKELYEIFIKFGEERLSARLVDLIEKRRSVKPFERSGDLYALVKILVTGETRRRAVASRVFQALRIAVNRELESLKQALPRAFGILRPEGRLVVISYHSLEDRLVKSFFLNEEKKGRALIITRRPVVPARAEIMENPSSHSAKLRALRKNND